MIWDASPTSNIEGLYIQRIEGGSDHIELEN